MMNMLGRLLFGAHESTDMYRAHASRTAIAPVESSNSMVQRAVLNLEREALGMAFLKRAFLLILGGAMALWLATHLSVGAAQWVSERWSVWRARVVEQEANEAMKASEQRLDAARNNLQTRMDALNELRRELRP